MSKENTIYFHKEIEIDDTVVYNIIADGLLSFGHSTLQARKLAEDIIRGKTVREAMTGADISKTKVLDAARRFLCSMDNEIEIISDSGREILLMVI
jgi:hypothetical protein